MFNELTKFLLKHSNFLLVMVSCVLLWYIIYTLWVTYLPTWIKQRVVIFLFLNGIVNTVWATVFSLLYVKNILKLDHHLYSQLFSGSLFLIALLLFIGMFMKYDIFCDIVANLVFVIAGKYRILDVPFILASFWSSTYYYTILIVSLILLLLGNYVVSALFSLLFFFTIFLQRLPFVFNITPSISLTTNKEYIEQKFFLAEDGARTKVLLYNYLTFVTRHSSEQVLTRSFNRYLQSSSPLYQPRLAKDTLYFVKDNPKLSLKLSGMGLSAIGLYTGMKTYSEYSQLKQMELHTKQIELEVHARITEIQEATRQMEEKTKQMEFEYKGKLLEQKGSDNSPKLASTIEGDTSTMWDSIADLITSWF